MRINPKNENPRYKIATKLREIFKINPLILLKYLDFALQGRLRTLLLELFSATLNLVPLE